ncbi:LysR family transcriptional regulator [Maribacter sp. 4U21]|uniref:LysR substrate-binding domain-containing protein n=1 Tax=Maribacter sp. 4U21 TaxID=1889779 RepID=UPI000C150374|nr:LysR substrate-binding domain-containing protein [Maribacter sp. 4U21]PIB27042.1 LysR family transcriptional regulator [Maribacter sp. 4U21]
MTLQQFRYIVTLDEKRHFASAAEFCHVSQPALTTQLKKFEQEIGIQIFDRTQVPLKPTELGLEIISKARKILRDVNEIEDYVINQKNTDTGIIKIGVINTLSPYIIPLAIKNIQSALPKVKFIINESSTLELIKSLKEGKIDIALMATPTGNSNLKEFYVFTEHFVAYLNPSHKMRQQDYFLFDTDSSEKLLMLKKEFCYNSQILKICNMKQEAQVFEHFNFEASSIETLKNLTLSDLGFSILPELATIREKAEQNIKYFKNFKPARDISLVVSHSFSKTLILEKLKFAIWKSIPEYIQNREGYKIIRWDDSPYFRAKLK